MGISPVIVVPYVSGDFRMFMEMCWAKLAVMPEKLQIATIEEVILGSINKARY